ncbi:MAG TPA: NAD(P)/FAD-dependent oxidoreductase [Chthoniobacterales bacterium]
MSFSSQEASPSRKEAAHPSPAPSQDPAETRTTVAIIGAGPAGLTAAYMLAKGGVDVTVFESDPTRVGGISRTPEYKGYRFDIGGHRFFSKSKEIEALWDEILPDDMLVRPRSSRIFYRGKFFSYPLRPLEAFFKLGWVESIRCGLSYLRARAFPKRDLRNFEEWVSDRFGSRLFQIFFKTYTEKVWGMPCTEISADWAAQRIKGLSLFNAVFGSLLRMLSPGARGKVVKTLIQSFRYPRLGPGMMWEACSGKIRTMGGRVEMGRRVVGCLREGGKWHVTTEDSSGKRETSPADHVISSMPVRMLPKVLSPSPSDALESAASSLKYRDFLTVVLICKGEAAFSDNWIYIHEPRVKVGRIQNFRSWSPEMGPEDGGLCYGLEYFCNEGDDLWNRTDEDLLGIARYEMEWLGLARRGAVVDGCVVRQPKAYPVYDDSYAAHVATIRAEIARDYPGFHMVGRNGMHRYNNQDHSMMTAILVARNIIVGRQIYDPWAVNEDAEYHEVASAESPGRQAEAVEADVCLA